MYCQLCVASSSPPSSFFSYLFLPSGDLHWSHKHSYFSWTLRVWKGPRGWLSQRLALMGECTLPVISEFAATLGVSLSPSGPLLPSLPASFPAPTITLPPCSLQRSDRFSSIFSTSNLPLLATLIETIIQLFVEKEGMLCCSALCEYISFPGLLWRGATNCVA